MTWAICSATPLGAAEEATAREIVAAAGDLAHVWAEASLTVTPPVPAADLDGDGVVAMPDLLIVLAAWGPCWAGPCPADLDGDGGVGLGDLLAVLAAWD